MLCKTYLCKWKYLHVEYLIQIKLISNQMTLFDMAATCNLKCKQYTVNYNVNKSAKALVSEALLSARVYAQVVR